MPIIEAHNLTKTYRVSQKKEGFLAALRGLFRREYKQVHAVEGVSFAIEPGDISATERETSSRCGVGPGQSGADPAARTGDENGARIPHPSIRTACGRVNIDIGRPSIVIAGREELLVRPS